MNILISGASGFLGHKLIRQFTREGHKITALSRNPYIQPKQENVIWKTWRANDYSDWQDAIIKTDVIINLVGESIAGKRWTKPRKKILLSSRVDSCKLLLKAIKECAAKPKLFLQISAIGIYSPNQKNINEKSATGGSFLADLTVKWEQTSKELEKLGISRMLLRTGLVLSADALLVKKFLLPLKLFIGGPVGNNKQMMSWIHIDDLCAIFSFITQNIKESTVFNLTAPNPVSMKEFCKALGKAVNRPSWLFVPGFVLKVLFGREMAQETMLSGQAVYPKNLIDRGFTFKYSRINEAFESLF